MSETENQVTEEPVSNEAETAPADQTQAEKMFSQEDIDKIVRDRLDRERKRFEKKYEGVDVDQYRQLMDQQEAERIEQQKQRGEFEEVLKSTVQKKDAAIQDLQNQLTQIKVDGSLLNSASARRAVNPQQVSELLRGKVRLGDTGDAEVLDSNGAVRYNDNGLPMSVDELVEEFLSTNPHFIQAGPNGSGAKSNIANTGKEVGKINVGDLDMNNPGDREIYKKYMKSKGIRM
jgi:hypothetical protein